jgi:hypothetical protein
MADQYSRVRHATGDRQCGAVVDIVSGHDSIEAHAGHSIDDSKADMAAAIRLASDCC